MISSSVNSITLQWTTVTPANISSYILTMTSLTAPDYTYTLYPSSNGMQDWNSSTPSYIVSSLQSGTDYSFTIQSNCETTTSALSNTLQATTSLIAVSQGCTDPTACNYSPPAAVDNGSCCYVTGCTDQSAVNFDPLACCDDGSCVIAPAGSTYIPDAIFEQALIDLGYDSGNPSGWVYTANINTVTNLGVHGLGISDLTGIEDFTALTSLNAGDNLLTSIDLSQNTALTYLQLGANQLDDLDVSANTALTQLYCRTNNLTSLDLSNNTALEHLRCHTNQLTSLDVSANTALDSLWCQDNQLTSLNVSQNTDLITLRAHGNNLTSVNVKNGNSSNWQNYDITGSPGGSLYVDSIPAGGAFCCIANSACVWSGGQNEWFDTGSSGIWEFFL